MDNKTLKIIVSNKNVGQRINRKVNVRFKHSFENNKKYFYLEFISDIWKEQYFLPLGFLRQDGILSNLNDLPLIHKNMGINLEELWRTQGLSLYRFIHDNREENESIRKEDFALTVVKFMYVFLDIPFDKMMQILNLVHNSNHHYYKGTGILLSSFDAVEK